MSLVKEAKIHENLDFLERFVGPDNNPKFFFTMTEINKVGINPRSTYDTPLGVYCYPLIREFYQKLREQSLPFAGSKPYVNLFTLNVPTFNMTTYTEAQLRKDTEHLKLLFNIQDTVPQIDPALQQKWDNAKKAYEDEGTMSYSDFVKVSNEYYKAREALENTHTKQTIDKAFREAKGGTPIGKFWNLTRILSGNAKSWNHLLRRLGYTNFYDPGTGLIHSNEPTQAVIVDPSVIIVVETFFNPHSNVEDYGFPHVPKHEKHMMIQRKKQVEGLAYKLETLENPAMLDKIAHSHIKNTTLMSSIVRNRNTTPETLRFIYDTMESPHNYVYNFTSNPNTPTDVLSKMFAKLSGEYLSGDEYSEAIVQHPNVSEEIIRKMAEGEDWRSRYAAAGSSKLPVDVAKKLMKDESESVRERATQNAPPEILHEIVADPTTNSDSKVTIVRNSTQITPELLTMLSKDKFPDVRAAVASSNKATPELLLSMVHDPNKHVKMIIGQGDRAPPEAYEILAQDPDVDVVRSVAGNENAPIEVLKKLAQDPREDIRNWVVRNYNVPQEIVTMLSNDTSPKILEFISDSYKVTPEVIKLLANNPHSTARVFNNLAKNADTPSEILLQLLQKPELQDDSYTMQYIAESRNATPEVLRAVYNTSGGHYLGSLARNPETPPDILTEIANRNDQDRYTLEGIAKNPNTPVELLNHLSRSQFTSVRSRIARNKRTPWDTLKRLTKDKDYDTSYYAADTLYEHPEREAREEAERQEEAMKQKLYQHGPIMAGDTMSNIQKTGKEDSEEKIPLSEVRKMPYKSLNRMIKKMKQYLKTNEVVQKMFKDYDVDISEIDYIPMMFGNLDVSAKTDHGVIILNYKLLTDGDFFKDFSYGVHEMTHWLQQTTGQKATQSSDDGSYLDNPYEQEGFQNQVEYIADQFGEGEAEQYVDDLLEHHEINNKKEHEDKKETLMSKV